MNSVIMQIASKYVRALLLLFAVIVLLRGHNFPGGGFIGGLLAGMSIVMKGFVYHIEDVRAGMRIKPDGYIALGLSLILVSVIPGVLQDAEYMKGVWTTISLPFSVEVKMGTPLLFDIGVFFAVIGVSTMFLFSLKRAE
jgi:multicomponent Na+:H+ antiporter subunit B